MASNIITVQLGPYSNYVGTHFWNLQEEHMHALSSDDTAGHDLTCFYDAIESPLGKLLYQPRVLAVDFESSLIIDKNQVQNDVQKALDKEYGFDLKGLESEQSDKNQTKESPFRSYVLSQQDHFIVNSTSLDVYESFKFHSTTTSFQHFWNCPWNLRDYGLFIPPRHEQLNTGVHPLEVHPDFQDDLFDRYRRIVERSDGLQALHCLLDWQSEFQSIGLATYQWFHEEAPKLPSLLLGCQSLFESQLSWSPSRTLFTYDDLAKLASGIQFMTQWDDFAHQKCYPVLLCDVNQFDTPIHPLVIDSSQYTTSALPATLLYSLSSAYRQKPQFSEVYTSLLTLTPWSNLLDAWVNIPHLKSGGTLLGCTQFPNCPPDPTFEKPVVCTVGSLPWPRSFSKHYHAEIKFGVPFTYPKLDPQMKGASQFKTQAWMTPSSLNLNTSKFKVYQSILGFLKRRDNPLANVVDIDPETYSAITEYVHKHFHDM